MGVTLKFIIFQCAILIPFAVGSIYKSRISPVQKTLIRINLICLDPLIVLWSIWGLQLEWSHLFLPVAGLLLVVAGMIIGTLLAPVVRLQGPSAMTFIITSSLANHGFTMGAFLCYLFMGERGLGLAFIFLSYFMPFIFLVIFPYARSASSESVYSLQFLKDCLLNLQNMPLYAVFAAILLHGLGIRRPDIFFPIDLLILVSIGFYYMTLGTNFRRQDILSSFRVNFTMTLIKFCILPILTLLVLRHVSLDPQLKEVILIEAFMPTAIYSVVAPVLFDLDARLASNMFVVNTILFLVFILPALFFFRERLMGVIG